MIRKFFLGGAAGFLAGSVTGLFGAGGGMVLVPLLTRFTDLEEEAVFPSSVAVILPVCIASLLQRSATASLPWWQALPYLIGSCIGGIAVGLFGRKIPVVWLHRILGIMILWGGVRYLC